MKRLIAVFLTFSFLFALFLELGGADPDKKFSWYSYVDFVTENIEPFPQVSLTIEFNASTKGVDRLVSFFEYLWNLVSYPVEVVVCLVRNAGVIFIGLFPVVVEKLGHPEGGTVVIKNSTVWDVLFPTWIMVWFK